MLDLLCPVCGGRLVREEKAWRCESRHSFDVARSGYVNLLPPSASGNAMATISAWSRRARRFYHAAIMII